MPGKDFGGLENHCASLRYRGFESPPPTYRAFSRMTRSRRPGFGVIGESSAAIRGQTRRQQTNRDRRADTWQHDRLLPASVGPVGSPEQRPHRRAASFPPPSRRRSCQAELCGHLRLRSSEFAAHAGEAWRIGGLHHSTKPSCSLALIRKNDPMTEEEATNNVMLVPPRSAMPWYRTRNQIWTK